VANLGKFEKRRKATDDRLVSDVSARVGLSLCARVSGYRTLQHQDTLGHFGTTKLVPKFKTNHRWSCVSSELSWVEVSRLFLDHGTRVEVSRTTFLVSKCFETGAEVFQSVLMPKCLVAEVSGFRVSQVGDED